ncbi:alpha/beta-hydrolase [Cerioporus squamosus]|nr:alpha/beta-hydrolase [Cerioporus squamosus]
MDVFDGKSEQPTALNYARSSRRQRHGRPTRGLSWRLLTLALAAAGSVSLYFGREAAARVWHIAQAFPTSTDSTPTKGFDWYALEPSTDIRWTPCFDGHLCARLLLPLDYLSTDPDGPTTAIALRLVPAKSRGTPAHRGTVLVNPGGPGDSATSFVAQAGEKLARVVGDAFDVLGFDARGTGASTPRADCFDAPRQRDMWVAQTGGRFVNASDETAEFFRARQEVVGARCEEAIGGERGIARFMSSASVATDMVRITEKLGQEKVMYWGFSYGSVLGQYFAAMYPEKVGRVIIDGVFDSHNYRAALWNSNLFDFEKVVESLFTYCHRAGPMLCPLYESTPEKIRERYFSVLDAVGRKPVAVPLAESPTVITRRDLVWQLFTATYRPLLRYATVVDVVRAIETANQTTLAALAPKICPPAKCDCTTSDREREPWTAENDAFSAIACGDGDKHPYDAETYRRFYADMVAESPHGGPIWAIHYLQCAEWRVRPRWRYTGPLAANATASPLLLVAPRYDPVCPLRDALRVRERYPGAGLLVQESHGHCTLAAPSVCTAKHVRAYLEDGRLPGEGTVCEADELPFVGVVRDVGAMSVEDRELLDAMRGLAEMVPTLGF